jgi:hypothetical protein
MTDVSNETPSAAEGLALVIETACEDFEIMQRLIAGEIRLSAADFRVAARAPEELFSLEPAKIRCCRNRRNERCGISQEACEQRIKQKSAEPP